MTQKQQNQYDQQVAEFDAWMAELTAKRARLANGIPSPEFIQQQKQQES